MEASRAKPLSGRSVTLFLILGQRKQDDRWVKLDETLRSHSPSMKGYRQKRLCDELHNVFTDIHSMRSLTSAARPVLAALRHIRSSVRSSRHMPRTTLAVVWENGRFIPGFTAHPYQK
jgi:hypothetical protein